VTWSPFCVIDEGGVFAGAFDGARFASFEAVGAASRVVGGPHHATWTGVLSFADCAGEPVFLTIESESLDCATGELAIRARSADGNFQVDIGGAVLCAPPA
jgi:hypothetical protein